MKSTVLIPVSLPPQRLFVAQKALPLSLGAGFFLFHVSMDLGGLGSWALIHGFLIYATYRDPYFMNVWQAFFSVGRTSQRHASGGNCYEL